jgi:hypothetical protein
LLEQFPSAIAKFIARCAYVGLPFYRFHPASLWFNAPLSFITRAVLINGLPV